jgi:hypothetical protein
MELGEAYGLQSEALRLIYEAGSASARIFPAYSKKADPSPQPDDIAIGVSRRADHGFQLAIRLQGTEGDVSPLVRAIAEMARGEVELAWIGAVCSYQVSAGGWQRSVSSTLRIGCSISHVQTPCGTLGCFVRQRTDPYPYGPVHLLSCSHVLSELGTAKLGDDIIQPGLVDCGPAGHRVVANLSGTSKPDISRVDNIVDAAFGAVERALQYDAIDLWPNEKLQGMAKIDPSMLGEPVFKIGRTSDRTTGLISAIDLVNLKMSFGGTPFIFSKQMEITSDTGRFSFYGDSGSLVVSHTLYALGLLMGGSYNYTTGSSFTYANPLSEVMDTLDLDLVI